MLSTGEALLSTGVSQIKLAVQPTLIGAGVFGVQDQSSFELTTLNYEQVPLIPCWCADVLTCCLAVVYWPTVFAALLSN